MTVPVIVEIIFRFIPSALLVFGFIEINLYSVYRNKYGVFVCGSVWAIYERKVQA